MELNDLNLQQELENVKLPLRTKFTTQYSRHETIKAQLHFLAFKFSLFPLPEAKIYSSSNHRIDMLWIDAQHNPIVAIEIDNSVYPKSIKKLSDSKAKFKIIFSLSRRKDRLNNSIKKIKELLGEIKIINPFI